MTRLLHLRYIANRRLYKCAPKDTNKVFHSKINYNDKIRRKKFQMFISSGKDKTLWHFYMDMTQSCKLMNYNGTQKHR